MQRALSLPQGARRRSRIDADLYDELIIAKLARAGNPRLRVILGKCGWEAVGRRLNAVLGVRSEPAVDDPPLYVLVGAAAD